MKSLLAALALTTAITIPAGAQARSVTLMADMANYGGRGAYLAVYLTDPSGHLAQTLWVAGGKSKYFRHLSDWASLSGGRARLDGISGASVGRGGSLVVIADIADAMIDAGYMLHIDAAVEDMRDAPSEIAVPLTSDGRGASASGRTYIANFRYNF